MSEPSPKGRFTLKRGIRLVQTRTGGLVMQSNPMRVLKINPSAFSLLDRCRKGLDFDSEAAACRHPSALAFLDTLRQGGLLDWTPYRPPQWPKVSIVIPVYNRAEEIEQCLTSLQALNYPTQKLEIIVVDDASRDHTAAVVRRFNARLVILPCNQGQSVARNAGVAAAEGEIVAFIDSDCVATPDWLIDLVPYFQDARVALVGGYVDADIREKRMDRYEQVCSALNMGPDAIMGRGGQSVFYVPTCNMLVRKEPYDRLGGLDVHLRVGEDVDLCWRLMAGGHHLLYIPRGRVIHKHRNTLLPGLIRRFEYGTSEAVLYARFPDVAKRFPWQPAGLAILTALAAALMTRSWIWLAPAVLTLALETGLKRRQLKRKMGIRLPAAGMVAAVIKSHCQLVYHLAFYMMRYYLLPLLVLAFTWTSMAWFLMVLILLPAIVAYLQRQPRLSFAVFLFFYYAEHAFYQSGAFWGCLRQKSFRLYRITFSDAGFMNPSNRQTDGRRIAVQETSKALGSHSP